MSTPRGHGRRAAHERGRPVERRVPRPPVAPVSDRGARRPAARGTRHDHERGAERERGARRAAAGEARRRGVRRRRGLLGAVLFLLVVLGAGAAIVVPRLGDAVDEIRLPLRHDDIVRQQASEKGLDPALVAAVIYAESRYRNGLESSAGAIGLMQVTPQTASDIARRSGGTSFVTGDLHEPQVNISYGAFHLRYLLEQFGGSRFEAVAAYNAGEGNVARWIAEERARGRELTTARIPFPETKAYVRKVLDARQQYRREYRRELGL